MTKNWEKEKERMHEFYMARGMKLATVQKIMQESYGFTASERAYKQKFKEWKWFKKTPRSPVVQVKQEDHDQDQHNHHSVPDNSHLYRMQPQRRSMTTQAHMEQAYVDQFATHHMSFEPDFGADMGPQGPYGQHPHHAHVTHHNMGLQGGNMTLTPYGRGGPPVSLPSVATLQTQAFKENIRDAERKVESGQYDSAEESMESAMRSLNWLKGGTPP